MSTETETRPDEDQPDGEPTDTPRHQFRPRHIFYGLVILGTIAMWAYVYSPFAVHGAPDALHDMSIGPKAEAICQATAAQLAALPKAFDTPDPNQRADVVVKGDDDLNAMIDQLAAVPWGPVIDQASSDRDHRIYDEWLGDWRTYLGNRNDYASRLRTDREARIFVTQKGAKQITDPIDGFAADSGMPSCATPGDIF